ncbi:MAG: hypothetical protein M1834_002132 [Cirrosporium novae-zelandiae]|nr:MAG: hypothetical protein M1834_002132 [Cirrosporium novae-zelandiae]
MSFQSTPHDVSLYVTSPLTKSERRITPTWTLADLKKKLQPVTGIPSEFQTLELKVLRADGSRQSMSMVGEGEIVGKWLSSAEGKVEEIAVQDSRPPSAQFQLPPEGSVPKYVLPIETYETLPSSVLAWKKSNKLGRFDPNKADPAVVEEEKIQSGMKECEERKISTNSRARIVSEPIKRGNVAFVGPIPELPGGGIWIGLKLDEPVGKNDGTVKTETGEVKRIFECPGAKYGVFVRPERVEVGDWDELGLDEEEEEI